MDFSFYFVRFLSRLELQSLTGCSGLSVEVEKELFSIMVK